MTSKEAKMREAKWLYWDSLNTLPYSCSICTESVEPCEHWKSRSAALAGQGQLEPIPITAENFDAANVELAKVGIHLDESVRPGQPEPRLGKWEWDWRWLRVRGYLRQWLEPHQFEIIKQCLQAAIENDQPAAQPTQPEAAPGGTMHCPYCGKDSPHEHFIDKKGNAHG